MKIQKSVAVLGLCGLTLTACVEPEELIDYRPVVDTYKSNMTDFDTDLSQCRTIALQVEADYKQRQEEEMARNMVAGLIAGVLIGAVAGAGSDYQGDYVAAGAMAGAAGGLSEGDYTYDLVTYGPRRVIDRCMADRGYRLLNDIGRG